MIIHMIMSKIILVNYVVYNYQLYFIMYINYLKIIVLYEKFNFYKYHIMVPLYQANITRYLYLATTLFILERSN